MTPKSAADKWTPQQFVNSEAGGTAFAEGTCSGTPGCKLTSIRADDDNVNIERQAQSSYRGGRTHEKERGDCGPSGLLGAVVSWTRLRNRKSPSAARASSNEQCKTSWIVRTPSACKPCSVSTGPRFTSASQTCCSSSGDTSQVYNPVRVSPSEGKRGRFPLAFARSSAVRSARCIVGSRPNSALPTARSHQHSRLLAITRQRW